MERGKKTSFILKQFKKKSKRVIHKDYFTEFFYLNRNREIIEFLRDDEGRLLLEVFFKEFIQEEFRDFIKIKILNDDENEITTWYYNNENLVIVIGINWGFKKQEISITIDIDNFEVLIIDDDKIIESVDYTMFNDHLISFLTIQARKLAKLFDKMYNQKKDKDNFKEINGEKN